jgi:hypothetical protein
MSTRRGYYWIAEGTGVFDGPYQTIKEAKADAQQRAPSVTVSIRAMVELERTNDHGEWQTVH